MKRVLEKLKVRLELVVLVIAAMAGLAGIFGAFVFLPQRVDGLETRVQAVAAATSQDHETLIRIEERLKAVQEKVDLLLQRKAGALAVSDSRPLTPAQLATKFATKFPQTPDPKP